MKTKSKFLSVKDTTISFLDFIKKFSTEHKALVYLENLRWGNRVICPFCGENKVLNEHIDSNATVMTDEASVYDNIGFKNHGVVTHSLLEFVKGEYSTNEIESVWAILKRGWKGIYHHMSPKHLQLYVNEFCFRLNDGKCDRHLNDRIKSLCGFAFTTSHMTYKQLLAKKGSNLLMRII